MRSDANRIDAPRLKVAVLEQNPANPAEWTEVQATIATTPVDVDSDVGPGRRIVYEVLDS